MTVRIGEVTATEVPDAPVHEQPTSAAPVKPFDPREFFTLIRREKQRQARLAVN